MVGGDGSVGDECNNPYNITNNSVSDGSNGGRICKVVICDDIRKVMMLLCTTTWMTTMAGQNCPVLLTKITKNTKYR